MKHGNKFLIADFLHGRSPFYVAAVFNTTITQPSVVF
uniref:Uncharacterized protein n=1 Tax=Ackermannviridae sp. TaxID=2831612 RepID=A0A8S5VPY2_9CAUD|nr:MAG TPA: hypothetical protein [Ackermannviridae sp.]